MKCVDIKILILEFVILCIIILNGVDKYIDERKNVESSYEKTIEFCKMHRNEESYQEFCEIVNNQKFIDDDIYYAYSNIGVTQLNKLNLFFFLIIAIPTLIYPCYYYKHKAIINLATRQKYKFIKNKFVIRPYISVFLFPLAALFAMVISWSITRNINPEFSLTTGAVPWNYETLTNPILSVALYFLNVIIHSILYVNICLCVSRKQHNYPIAVILSTLIFIGIEIFLEVILGGIIFGHLLNSNKTVYFNIMNFFTFNDNQGWIWPMLIPFTCMLISLIAVYMLYKNKENLIITCEKND